ncbi:MAG: FmdB family zinc ribbon protein [Actinomycetota bacterium]
MPTYEYVCTGCQNRVEIVQSFTDAALETCELCAGRLRKIIFPVGIQFKGSGFYSTDRKASQPISRVKEKDKDKDRSDGKDGKKDSGPSEAKGDSKSEVKSDSPAAVATKKAVSEKSA